MGFKDSTMAMGDVTPSWREVWINHAVTARDAFGAGAVWMRSDDGSLQREFAELNYTRRLQRWNAPHSQANLWLVAGFGEVRGNGWGGGRTMWAPGLSADWESTRLYFSATARMYRAEGLNHDYAAARAGFSFYETDYDQVQPWLVLEGRRMRGLSEQTEWTPMLRLIHSRYFVEWGVNPSGQGRFNFMYIF